MGMLKIIELHAFDDETLVQKFDMKDNVIKKGSSLTVRESQAAVFCDKGKTADVFGAGTYRLNTDSLPIVSKLLAWKYGFETPFKSEIYFINLKEIAGIRWGTSNPVPVQTEYGIIRLRGNGAYSFKITDPALFLASVAGMAECYETNKLNKALRTLLVGNISSAFATCNVSLSDMTSKYAELSEEVKKSVAARCGELGITLTAFEIENLSVPPELEKAVDENARLGLMRNNVDVYAKIAQADALKAAAGNGTAGTILGVGVGSVLGKEVFSANTVAPSGICSVCRKPIRSGSKFCAECGNPIPKFCSRCGKPIVAGANFCPECGQKLNG
ncbi:MAG: zinc-ribbon domain-containing protein [Clostridia bacterium]|nr:zinc-ribbon domain-containing protein [Clostridia bacterium]